ncbi:efflux transporter outer membrane subunit [Pseudomonas cichorii]|nr:efflux transporter outer membrane subunit [Pseudomonas cichorii]
MDIFKTAAKSSLPILIALIASGCVMGPDYQPPAVSIPAHWHAPLPHDASVKTLSGWWQQFNDPQLEQLLQWAEADSPTLDQAWANIQQARATLAVSDADASPTLRGTLARNRTGERQDGSGQTYSSSSAGLDAAWELDLFGKFRRNREAASNRIQARVDDWHDARVSLAAEVADDYVQYRGCQRLVLAYQEQLDSQRQTAELTGLSLKAGFTAPADLVLTQASAASNQSTLINQRSECELLLKQLTQLTGSDEDRVRELLGQAPAILPSPARLDVHSIPADLIRQRPDLASRERELAAASADIGVAEAQRWPSLSLSGSFAVGTSNGQLLRNWTVGPALSLPLLDGGLGRATVKSAEAAYDSALAAYRQTLRTSVGEVEQALVRLDAARRREADVERATQGYSEYFQAVDKSWQAGGVSILDREVARRSALDAQIELITLQQEQVRYWIALYKALGGGWQDSPENQSVAQASGGKRS